MTNRKSASDLYTFLNLLKSTLRNLVWWKMGEVHMALDLNLAELYFCSLCLYIFSDPGARERTTQPAGNVTRAAEMARASLSVQQSKQENPSTLAFRTGTAEKTKTRAHAEQRGAWPSLSLWKHPGQTAHSHCCTPNHCNMPSGTYAHSPQGWNKLWAQRLLPAAAL